MFSHQWPFAGPSKSQVRLSGSVDRGARSARSRDALRNAPQRATAEDQLLVQFQGMIAEYERAQILERYRRGKRHPPAPARSV